MITNKIQFLIGLGMIAFGPGLQALNDGNPDMIWEKPFFGLALAAIGIVLAGLSIKQAHKG